MSQKDPSHTSSNLIHCHKTLSAKEGFDEVKKDASWQDTTFKLCIGLG